MARPSTRGGMVLARIDDSVYQADTTQAEAQVRVASAGIQRAEADREQMKAKFRQAERDWQRAQKGKQSDALCSSKGRSRAL